VCVSAVRNKAYTEYPNSLQIGLYAKKKSIYGFLRESNAFVCKLNYTFWAEDSRARGAVQTKFFAGIFKIKSIIDCFTSQCELQDNVMLHFILGNRIY
jgi:hypothetical protein